MNIEPGRIFTLLGRNGAGKTTFVRICATQLLPTSGTIKVFENDLIKDTEKIRNYISIVLKKEDHCVLLHPGTMFITG